MILPIRLLTAERDNLTEFGQVGEAQANAPPAPVAIPFAVPSGSECGAHLRDARPMGDLVCHPRFARRRSGARGFAGANPALVKHAWG